MTAIWTMEKFDRDKPQGNYGVVWTFKFRYRLTPNRCIQRQSLPPSHRSTQRPARGL